VRRTRIADIAIIHFKTSFVGYRGRGMTHIYRSLAGEACLAPTKPCKSKATYVILLPLQGAYIGEHVIPKALPWAKLYRPFRAKNKLPPFVIRHL